MKKKLILYIPSKEHYYFKLFKEDYWQFLLKIDINFNWKN